MITDVASNVFQILEIAFGAPARLLEACPANVRAAALERLGDREMESHGFEVDGDCYLACRGGRERNVIVVLGPLPPLTEAERERAARALPVAAASLRDVLSAERERLALASHLEVVNRAVLAVSSALDLDTVLRRIVDLSRELVGAHYSALGVPDERGTLASFATSGVSDEAMSQIGSLPSGRGVLGLLLHEKQTVRLTDVATHPASAGFPPHHPPMRSLLSVPILAREEVLGRLYLSEKLDGRPFTDEDARLVEVLARHAAVAIENARLYQARELEEQRLQLLVNQLPEAVILCEAEPERVTLVNQQTNVLLGWEVRTPMPLEEFLGRNARFGLDARQISARDVPLVQSLRNGEAIERNEVSLQRPDGSRIAALVNSAPIEAGGKIVGAVAVFQDITQIRDAEQLKDEFLSLVSHELRTPLTSIQGDALLLLRDWSRIEPGIRHELLTDMSSESRRLAQLIENMVQLANIRAGRLPLNTEPVLVAVAVKRAVAAFREIAPDQPVSMRFEPGLLAEADPVLMEETLRILLNNASKYASGSPIKIDAKREDDRVLVRVRDHGPGIAPEELPRIFDRFYQSRRNPETSTSGLGLGLYLARHLVEANRGAIWVEAPPDGGARLVFSVPAVSGNDD